MSDTHPVLILASQSPRRRQLLEDAGYRFQIVSPRDTAECGICSRETPPELVARLAAQKAEDVVERLPAGLVIGCDTVAECCGQILGKPRNLDHAREMLHLLRGRRHQVFSGLCLWQVGGQPHVQVDVTRLEMELLSDEALEEYLGTHAWEGKAGGFGYQDRHGWLRILEGSESNVVGLPMELLDRMLKEMGYSHWSGAESNHD